MAFPTLTTRQAAGGLAILAILQALFNTTLPLSGDEAYYWVWAQSLQAGYHDHPPAIAVLMALTTGLLGDSVFAVRLVAVLCMSGAAFFMHLTAREVAGDRVGTAALLLAVLLPATEAGYTLATPDSPLILFWAAGIYFARRAVVGEGAWRDFGLAGLCAGCAMASKYTAVLLPGAIAAFVVLRRRELLLSPRLWAAVAVAVAAFSPVLWWNATHGFESFAFQYHHGTGETLTIRWNAVLEFLGGQVLVVSPVVFGLLVARVAVWREWWGDDKRLFLMTCFLLPALFFLYKALFAKIQLNWALPVYIAAVPLVAEYVVARQLRRLAMAGAVLAILMGAAFKWPLAFGLTGKLNPQNRLHGADVAVAALAGLRQPGDALFADHLQRASLLRFLLPDHPRIMIPTGTRYSEYSRWDAGVDFHALHGLYLAEGERDDDLRRVFAQVARVRDVTAEQKGFRTEHYVIYRVGG